MSAMKVVSEARKFGLNLMMADIFQQDSLAGLAHHKSPTLLQVGQELDGVLLIEPDVKKSLFADIDLLDLGIHSGDVADIYPVTDTQELLINTSIAGEQLADYFYIDLDTSIDVSNLESSCNRVLENIPILRSSFLQLRGKFWQVVLRQYTTILRVQDIFGELDESFLEFCRRDVESLSMTQPIAGFILLKHKTHGMRLVLRMSHAQYDAFSAPIIFRSVFAVNNGIDVTNMATFSLFLSYASRKRAQSIAYWKSMLQRSRLTVIGAHIRRPAIIPILKSEAVYALAEARLRPRPSKITAATLVRTAWAVVLSRLSGSNDVVYGQVVAGRNLAILGIEKIVGCCLNVVPTRIIFSRHENVATLIHAVQDQLLAMGEADTLGFKDIFQNCTDWPATSEFESIIHHRNVEDHPEIQTPKGRSQMQSFYSRIPSPCIIIISTQHGGNIRIHIVANTSIMTLDTGNKLASSIAQIIEQLVTSMHMPLSSFLDNVEAVI